MISRGSNGLTSTSVVGFADSLILFGDLLEAASLHRANDRCGEVEESSEANTGPSNYRLLAERGCQARRLAGDAGFPPPAGSQV